MVARNAEELNLAQENLHCHHILFIKDVTSSIYDYERNLFIVQDTQLTFRRVRLNGIIVAQETLLSNNNEQEYIIWLDDGTSVIMVILSKAMLNRTDAKLLTVPYNVTLFGSVEMIRNQHVIRCGGFKVEDNDTAEIYHWLRALQERPKAKKSSEPHQRMFYTLSSFPSPKRLLNENFLESPIRDDMNSQNVGFLWSPDHQFATSTPIRAVQEASQSPLRTRSDKADAATYAAAVAAVEESDDEFGDFDSGDLLQLDNT